MAFTILHISDAHIGNPKYDLDSQHVFRTFFEDLGDQQLKYGSPDLIIFNGDLAWGQMPDRNLAEQYSHAEKFLNRVLASVVCERDRCPVLLVPGNHDLDRKRIGSDQLDWRETLFKQGEAAGDLIEREMRERSIVWERMLERQSEWVKFANRFIRDPIKLDPTLNMTHGELSHSGISIAIVGLNSAWACANDDDSGRIWVGKRQLQAAMEIAADKDFSIAVAHHPVDWLHAAEKNWIKEKIQTHFRMFFHGHEHSSWFEDQEAHALVAAGPCYQGAVKENAYSWVSIDFSRRSATISLRRYEDKGGGGWIPFVIPAKTDPTGIGTLNNLFMNWTSRSANSASKKSTVSPHVSSSSPARQLNVPLAIRRADVGSLSELMAVLGDRFGFRWEPNSFDPALGQPLVYWPVRLRHPTPIHAVQCFAAAVLQQADAQVHLFVDDLGTQDYPVESFEGTLCKWFATGNGRVADLKVKRFSEILTTGSTADPWPSIRRWLGDNPDNLEKILRISKLVPATDPKFTLQDLNQKRPRRLLTPAIVWSCLVFLHKSIPERPLITLSGYDERLLWQASRDLATTADAQVGHLYVPLLSEVDNTHGTRALHMADTNISIEWASKEDIRLALEEEVRRAGSQWYDDWRLIPWCLNCCVFVPRFARGQAVQLSVGNNVLAPGGLLQSVSAMEMVQSLTDELPKWLM